MNSRISRNSSPQQIKPETSKKYEALSLLNFDLRTIFSTAFRLLEVTFQLNLNYVWYWNFLSSRKPQQRQSFTKKSSLRSLSSSLDSSDCSDLDDDEIESENSWGQFVELTDETMLVPSVGAQ